MQPPGGLTAGVGVQGLALMRGRVGVVVAGLVALGLLVAGCRTATGAGPPAARPLGVVEGFGGSVTGGVGGETRWVTSLGDGGAGSLREALEAPGAAWVRFGVSGRIVLGRPIGVTSDKTVDGRGAAVTISGDGLRIAEASNVVVTGLVFAGGRGDTTDAISVREGAAGVWIDHCEFSDYDDGLVDITRGATDVTVSWSRFTDQDKVMLINAEGRPERARVTVHHNVFDGTNQRHPRVVGNVEVHAYNNLVRHWTGYGMQAAGGGVLVSEANVFDAGSDRRAIKSGGRVSSAGDVTLNGAEITADTTRPGPRPDGYHATIDTPNHTLQAAVDGEAGPVGAERPPAAPAARSEPDATVLLSVLVLVAAGSLWLVHRRGRASRADE